MNRCNILAAALVAFGTIGAAEASAQRSAMRPHMTRTQQGEGASQVQSARPRSAAKPPRASRRAAPGIPVPANALCSVRFNALVYYPPEELAKGSGTTALLRWTAYVARGAALRLGSETCSNGLPVRWI